jgi:hypothetical protein
MVLITVLTSLAREAAHLVQNGGIAARAESR